jgi:erythronate-4-phosphate dehydrogenase
MQILVDENIPYANEFFAEFGDVTTFNGRHLNPEQLRNVDALLVRSITKVNAELLQFANRLKFVGTATIGEDHIDKTLLAEKSITFSSAPGCNANSVAEFVISSLFVLHERYDFTLNKKTIAIVGYGNIGKNLYQKCAALDLNIIVVDPFVAPLANVKFVDLETALREADIVSFHTPLTSNGEHPTHHLLNENNISLLKSNVVLINASRGEVIDNDALFQWKTATTQHQEFSEGSALSINQSSHLILDVWENEPQPLKKLIPLCEIATPHIAGYSLEGKSRGTEYLYQQLCTLTNTAQTIDLLTLLPQFEIKGLELANQALDETILKRLVHIVYDVRRDDARFRKDLNSVGFDYLRKNYPSRREWSAIALKCTNTNLIGRLSQLGFNVSAPD